MAVTATGTYSAMLWPMIRDHAARTESGGSPGQQSVSRIPTSVLLEDLLADAPPDFVTLAWLFDRLHERSFGIVTMLLALVALLPGLSLFLAIPLGALAAQMMLAQHGPILPRFVAARPISTPRLARLIRRSIPLLRQAERFIYPRWPTPFVATKRAVGSVMLVLSATLLIPIPFSHIAPALSIMLLAFAYIEEDGALLCVALVAALVSLAISTAGLWATAITAGRLGWF